MIFTNSIKPFENPLFAFPNRWSRAGIYVLLVSVMTLGIGLSLTTSHMVEEARKTSTMLLGQDVPKLEQFTAFESALLLHQAALDNDAAYPGAHERFHGVADDTEAVMHRYYPLVARELHNSPDMAALRLEFKRLNDINLVLRASLETRRGSAETRSLLADFNACTDRIRGLVDRGRISLRQAVVNGGRMTLSETDRIASLVHLYIGFALLSAVCLAYHVHARVKSERKLAYLATHDELTRLPHRWTFVQRVQALAQRAREQESRKRSPYTHLQHDSRPEHLLLIEADRFDRMAAGMGHALTDQLVQNMASRVRQLANEHGAQAYRLGESKFALLIAGQLDSSIHDLAGQLQARMSEPINIGSHEIVLSTSIGSAATAGPGPDGLAMVQDAESALHLARQRGSMHVAYCEQLDGQVKVKLAIETQLRHAIDRGELELYYQPQQRLSDGSLIGFEALLRWKTGASMVPPAQFIPIAEECGLILHIGDWVLAQACRQAALWNRHDGAPLTVAVNVSPRQFSQPRFLERLRQHLARSGAAPEHLELEITEGILMEQAARSTQLLAELRALGLKLAIDDFGTGYSSLAYLKRFPVHKLKIDQAFVRQLKAGSGDAEIVKAVINLGHNLGFSVIAEGVEAAEQAALLASWNCDEIQGYYFGKPMPAAAASGLVARRLERLLAEA